MTDTSEIFDTQNTSQVSTSQVNFEISKNYILKMVKENNKSNWRDYMINCIGHNCPVFEEFVVNTMYDLMITGDEMAITMWKLLTIGNASVVMSIHKMLFERIYLLNQVTIFENNMWVLNGHVNKKSLLGWVSDGVACYPMIMIPDRPELTIYFLTYIVQNHNLYDIQIIWKNIYECIKHQIKKINPYDVMMICIGHNLPRISQNIVSVLSIIDDETSLRIVTEMLERNIEVEPNFVFYVITNRKVKLLELFLQYNVDVKQIMNSIPCRNTQQITNMGQVLDKLGVTLTDYLWMINGDLGDKNSSKKFSFVMN